MNVKLDDMKQAIGRLPKPGTDQPKEPEQVDMSGRKEIRQTLYLPFGVHDQLRDVSYTRRISMQEIVRRALDMWFAEEGLPSWDEAKAKRPS